MGEQALAPMSVDEYYAWGELQEERYEYVDGFPVRMMSGASRRHDQIVVNIIAELRQQLRGGSCRPFTADTAVATRVTRRRRPDIGIESGERRDADYAANAPRVVVEVLSPSTREFNLYGKLDEYKALDSLDTILLVEPNAPDVMVWTRPSGGEWSHERVEGLEAEVALASVGARLRLAEIYDGLTFPAPPRARVGPNRFTPPAAAPISAAPVPAPPSCAPKSYRFATKPSSRSDC